MLATSSYLAAVAELLIIVGGALLGASALRRRLLPSLQGPPAWLAVAVLTVALLLWTAELLGVFGLFREAPLVICSAVLGLGLHLGLRAPPSAPAARGVGPPDPGTPMRLAGIAIAAVAIAHFTVGVRLRLGTGMTGFDSTWYHGPFAAGFAQSGDLGIRFIAPQFLSWFYPQSSELLHGIGILAFGRDLLSPLLNLGWLTGCLAAAWCIGRPFGAAPLSMAGAAIALNTGALADQAGEARNDLMAAFFLLAALALAVNALARQGGRQTAPGALAVIGIAAGIAAGTKLNFLAPAVALLAGLAVTAPVGARARALGAAGLPALAAGGIWYLRNLVNAGSPLPWAKELGPIGLPSPDQPLGGREGHSVISYLGDISVASDWFAPGLEQGFGTLWPLLAAAALAGLALSLGRRAEPPLRISALAGVVLLVAWALAPTGASGPDGEPRGFVSGLRYLAPALAIGMALLPAAPILRGPRQRWALLAGLVLLLPFSDASAEPWHSGYLVAALAVGALAAGAALVLRSQRLAALPRSARAALATVVLISTSVAGERGQRTYLANRYAEPSFAAPGLNAAFAWAREGEGLRIATIATRQYPLFGTDLSNEVQFVGEERPHAGFVRTRSCRAWRRALNAGDYDYAVVSRDRIEPGSPLYPVEAAWTRDPKASEVLRVAPTVVFRLRGDLPLSGCAARGAENR